MTLIDTQKKILDKNRMIQLVFVNLKKFTKSNDKKMKLIFFSRDESILQIFSISICNLTKINKNENVESKYLINIYLTIQKYCEFS